MSQSVFWNQIKKVSPFVALLFILISAFLLIKYIEKRNMFLAEREKNIGKLADDTEIVPESDEEAMIKAYNDGKNDDGTLNTYKSNLNAQVGIMHHLPTLVDQFNKWINDLKIDSTNFKFSVVPSKNSDDKGKLTIIMIPAINRNTRYTYDTNNKSTWAVDLGDLHP